jgi:hypothetical protein
LEGQVLAGFESRQGFAIVGLEIERIDVLAFADFAEDAEFAQPAPKGFGLLDLFELGLGDFYLKLQALALHEQLGALMLVPAKRRPEDDRSLTGESADQRKSQRHPGHRLNAQLRKHRNDLHLSMACRNKYFAARKPKIGF